MKVQGIELDLGARAIERRAFDSSLRKKENVKTVTLAVVKIIVTMVTNNNLKQAAFKLSHLINHQGPDFDDMSSFFPCEIDDAIQYINLRYGAQAPKTVIL